MPASQGGSAAATSARRPHRGDTAAGAARRAAASRGAQATARSPAFEAGFTSGKVVAESARAACPPRATIGLRDAAAAR